MDSYCVFVSVWRVILGVAQGLQSGSVQGSLLTIQRTKWDVEVQPAGPVPLLFHLPTQWTDTEFILPA